MKQCSVCKEFKSLDEFYRVSGTNRHRSACKQCTSAATKIYADTSIAREIKTETQRKRRKINGPQVRNMTEEQKVAKACGEIKRKYGITCEQRDALLKDQNNLCASCGKPLIKQVIDHDHITGEVRGILCYNCNVGIGLLGDTPEGLRHALSYLEGKSNASCSDN